MNFKSSVIYNRNTTTSSREIRELCEFANANWYTVRKAFEDKAKDYKDSRVVLQECIDYCIAAKINTILVYDVCQFGCDMDDLYKNVKYCRDNGVNVFFVKQQVALFNMDGNANPFQSYFVATLEACARIAKDALRWRLRSARSKYVKGGGKLGRHIGYRKSEDRMRQEYAGVIAMLRDGISVRKAAKANGVSASTAQRIRRMFIS